MIFITEERLTHLLDSLSKILAEVAFQKELFKVRFVAGIAGQILSLQVVLGSVCRVKTPELYKCIDKRSNWDSFVLLSNSAVTELDYWRLNVKTLNKEGRAIRSNQVCTLTAFCDASATGYGGYIESCNLNSSNADCFGLPGVVTLDCEPRDSRLFRSTVSLKRLFCSTLSKNFAQQVKY